MQAYLDERILWMRESTPKEWGVEVGEKKTLATRIENFKQGASDEELAADVQGKYDVQVYPVRTIQRTWRSSGLATIFVGCSLVTFMIAALLAALKRKTAVERAPFEMVQDDELGDRLVIE